MTRDRTIFIRNVYQMLAYACSYMDLRPREERYLGREPFPNIHSLFAAILGSGVNAQLKRGLFRAYEEREERMETSRGRIMMAETIRARRTSSRVLVCAYDELSENNLCNRVLKTAMGVLLRYSDQLDRKYQEPLRQAYYRFSSIEWIEPSAIPWSRLRVQRANRSYGLLLGVSHLLLSGMLMATEGGEYRLATFLDEENLHRLYEKFLLEYYRQEWRGKLSARPARIPWALDDGAQEMLPAMITDITLEQGNRVLILDAKYYASNTMGRGSPKVHSHNLYQIFAYVKNREAAFGSEPHEVSGMLLYARTDAAVQPDVSFRMSGNRISVRTLDLNRPFEEIAACLDGIAREYFPPL